MGKRVLMGLGVLALVILAAAGGFFYGTSVGEDRAIQARESFFQERLGGQGGQFQRPGGTPQPRQGGATRFGGGIVGTIEAVEGETLIISSDEEIVRVQTTDTTLIEKNMPVSMGDLEVGEMVVVSGPQNEDGSVTARSIQSLREFSLGQPPGGE